MCKRSPLLLMLLLLLLLHLSHKTKHGDEKDAGTAVLLQLR